MQRSFIVDVLLGMAAVALVLVLSLSGLKEAPQTYAGECEDGRSCSQEEVRELYASYKEECSSEGCSQEEINELSGGLGPGFNTYQDRMMNAFLKYQWYIRAQDISTRSMAPNAAWLYSGANYSGLLYQVWGSVNQSVADLSTVGFDDMTASLRIGPDVYLATYNDLSYSGAQLVVSQDQASLGTPFLNAISSARVSLYTDQWVPNLPQAVQNVEATVGAPARTGAQASRSNAGINSTFVVQLDVGGEGPTDCHGVVSGFSSSMNLNDITNNSTCGGPNPPPIPNLILLQSWNTNPAYPFVNGFADYVTMQGAPLTPNNVSEITRVLRQGGTVALWVNTQYNQSGINELAANLNTTPQYNVYDEFGGKAGYPKTLIVDNR